MREVGETSGTSVERECLLRMIEGYIYIYIVVNRTRKCGNGVKDPS